MEATSPTSLSPPRAYHYPYSRTRASSRSSPFIASDGRMAASNLDRRPSNLTPSPQPNLQQQEQLEPASYLTHRFQSSISSRPAPYPFNTGSPRLRPPRELSEEPKLFATSSYLQERLLRERKVESERSASRMSGDRTSSIDLGSSQGSPARSRSITGNGESVKKKGGVGLKEMEQTLTTLHKQNFDLKLELFHRREKQSRLEEKCESLDREKREAEEMNDKLLTEVEMRDKAVEEAVGMIIALEARLEQLLREREMVHQVEKHNLFVSNPSVRRALSSASRYVAADLSAPSDHPSRPKHKPDEGRTLNRMPSFLSERSEYTENLRNVYLGSLISLPRMSEDNTEGDFLDVADRVGSPSLSVLSESSFLSIYGKENEPRMSSFAASMQQSMSSVPADIPRNSSTPSHHASTPVAATHTPLATMPYPDAVSETTLRKQRSSSRARTSNGAAGLSSQTDYIGTNSPLQRLEKMELSLQAMDDASQPSSDEGLEQKPESLTHQLRARDFGKSTSGGKRDHLRRQIAAPQPSSTSAFNSRRFETCVHNGYFDDRLQVPPRPRSTDESTLSHYGRGSVWGDSESSDDDMDIDGNDSASMQDCWLRESLRPAGLAPRTRRGGKVSPDLFHFPSTVNGWSTNEMFGKSGQGYPGPAADGAAPSSNTLDKLGDSLPAPVSGLFGAGGLLASPLPYDVGSIPGGPPPPPNRRSSLHAQTGSLRDINSRCASQAGSTGPGTPSTSVSNTRTRRSPVRVSIAGGASASLCAATEDSAPEKKAQSLAVGQLGEQMVLAKMRHYPPTSGLTPRNRVLSLFRRSGSHELTPALAPASAPATATTFSLAPGIGVPSRMRKGEIDGEGGRSSATPPPILRNGRGGASSNSEVVSGQAGNSGAALKAPEMVLGANEEVQTVQIPAITQAPAQEPQVVQDDANASVGTTPRKKWLGLGRVANLRARVG
ncbi:hypothetical protein CMQ_6756 [Grosmannia clavigera kw1407]|uniref:Centrosomin N-terminal motif 1 domain-containing protein n=1 Tax=Grosmannia clavigera (strain kw1407 / UAMH 11150) TaxID=655863 RepID=F0X7U3_GROCL|nr:uncharacterized protein CMQ_6756 [Grosmannia clavigera kw1407]EFX06435.1 hypothetical protein CMQ_6756 [Grosmannia clavigera kw1407]